MTYSSCISTSTYFVFNFTVVLKDFNSTTYKDCGTW